MEILLLPGMDGTGRLYQRLIQALPEDWHALAIAYPADIVSGYEVLIQTLQMQPMSGPFLVLAESYSTPLAIRFAASRPEGLIGLVLCAGFASSPLRGLPRKIARLLSPILFHLPLPTWALEHFLIDVKSDAFLVEAVRAAIASVRPEVLTARLAETLDCNVRDELAEIDVPVLYLQAVKDRLVGPECLSEILDCRADVEVARISGPHLLLQLEPQLAVTAIEAFLKKIDATLA